MGGNEEGKGEEGRKEKKGMKEEDDGKERDKKRKRKKGYTFASTELFFVIRGYCVSGMQASFSTN